MAVDSNLGAVVGAEEGAIGSNPGNEGRIAQAWVNVRGGLRVFSVYFWHSEGWTLKNEALLEAFLKQAKTTRYPWLIACDANMCSEDFEKSLPEKKRPRAGRKAQKVSGSKQPMTMSLRVTASKETFHR